MCHAPSLNAHTHTLPARIQQHVCHFTTLKQDCTSATVWRMMKVTPGLTESINNSKTCYIHHDEDEKLRCLKPPVTFLGQFTILPTQQGASIKQTFQTFQSQPFWFGGFLTADTHTVHSVIVPIITNTTVLHHLDMHKSKIKVHHLSLISHSINAYRKWNRYTIWHAQITLVFSGYVCQIHRDGFIFFYFFLNDAIFLAIIARKILKSGSQNVSASIKLFSNTAKH